MKIFHCVLFLALFFGAESLTEQQLANLEKLSKECREQTGVTIEAITKARNGEFADDPKLKEQMLCIGKKVGLVDESGEILTNILRNKLKKVSGDEAEVDKILGKCLAKKDTPEETIFAVIKCVMKNKPKFSPVD